MTTIILELFILDYPYAGKLSTYVMNMIGQTFVKKATLPYLVRSFIVDGTPYIIGQKQHFEYLARGNIFNLVLKMVNIRKVSILILQRILNSMVSTQRVQTLYI